MSDGIFASTGWLALVTGSSQSIGSNPASLFVVM